jgi:putative ABC transport system permease protein
MTKLILRGLFTRKLRTILTSIAIVLGVAMISGTFTLTGQIDRAFSDIISTGNEGVDVVVSKQEAFDAESMSGGGPLDQDVIDQVAAVPGIAHAVGQIQATGSLVVDGDYVSGTGGAPNLVFSDLPGDMSPNTYTQGSAPDASGEVALIESLAQDNDLTVGQHVQMATDEGLQPVTIAGIFKFGDVASIGGATVVVTTFADAQDWFDREGQTSLVLAKAEDGVTPAEAARAVSQALPQGIKVQTGDENADEQTEQINASFSFLTYALLAFAGAAVFVGAFIIFNTFSITVAQRMREFALLRTLGATRRQVLRSVIGEALVIGVSASIIGLAFGFAFARFVTWLFDAAGFGIPVAGARLEPTSVLSGTIVGVLITLVAALLPARRATKVPPIAAMREGVTFPRSRGARFTPYVAALFVVGGLALVLRSVFGAGSTTTTLLGLVVGAILVFVGMAMVSRWIVRPVARAIGWPIERFTPVVGRLARENTIRNPGRTAVTSAALMIGLGLIVFVAVFVNGLRTSFTGALDRSVKGDLIITHQQGFGPIPTAIVPAAQSADGVEAASGTSFDQVELPDGSKTYVNGVETGTFQQVYEFTWVEGGSPEVLSRLGTSGMLVEENTANDKRYDVGDTVRVTGPTGESLELEVLGIYDDPQLFTGILVSEPTFRDLSALTSAEVILVRFEDSADPDAAQRSVENALQRFPVAKVQSNAEYKQSIEEQVNTILYLFYALLGMAVVISLFGMVNTLALSVFERTREIGMLRAIGTTRRQLRRMIRYESVITAALGGLLGVAVGVVFAWIVALGLEDEGLAFSVPYAQLVVALVVATIAGVLAAVLPARRASRLNVLDALHYE